jgi:hypothetical protein
VGLPTTLTHPLFGMKRRVKRTFVLQNECEFMSWILVVQKKTKCLDVYYYTLNANVPQKVSDCRLQENSALGSVLDTYNTVRIGSTIICGG